MGLGDAIMATAQARRAKAENPGALVLVGDGRSIHWSPVFEGNPNIAKTAEPGQSVVWVRNHVGSRPYVDYERSSPERLVYREGFRVERGDLFVSEKAEKWADAALGSLTDFVIVEPNTKGTFGGNKAWPMEYWQELAFNLPNAVQLGAIGAPALDGAKRIATPEFRYAIAILKRAKRVITTDGALHHAAAALGVPATVIWGGRTDPKILGYDGQAHLAASDGFCGMNAPCPHCADAMRAITPEMVLAAA